jgi:hypothetical protein
MGTRPINASRTHIVLMITLLMAAIMAATPAMATVGGDDIEAVRSEVAGTFTYKIGLLADLKDQTDNADRKAVYQAGIGELTSLRDGDVATEDDIGALWALKDRAHSIYGETKAAADQVGKTPSEELAEAKAKATSTIEYKMQLLRKWIEGCDDAEAQRIVNSGLAQLEGLFAEVAAAGTADAAYALKDRAHQIYHTTMDAAEAAKGDEPKAEDPPKEKTKAEKAAEELAAQRRTTLNLIARKTAILASAATAAKIPAVVDVYTGAAAAVEALGAEAKAASSASALKALEKTALDLYEAAKADAMAIREGSEDDSPVETIAGYLDSIVNYVSSTTRAAERTSDQSPDTFDELADAKKDVMASVDAVRSVADSGNRLDDRWDDLNGALRSFRRAVLRHYIALGEPMMIAGLQIPG